MTCEDDKQLERLHLEPPGIYWYGEVNEGPPYI